jgi:DNA-binding transcriptional LysR family regulator
MINLPQARLSWNARPMRTLEAIARLGSVSDAAAELGYTQSAASQHLAALERETGLTLIERNSRPLRPTAAGAVVLTRARGILAGFVAIEDALGEIHRVAIGRLRIVSFASALATFVPRALARFAQEHPGVDLQVEVAEPTAALQAVRAGAADLAIVHRDDAAGEPEPPGLRRVPLFADRVRAVMAASHALAGRRELLLGDLRGVPLILPSHRGGGRAHRSSMESLLREAAVEPAVAYEVDDLRAAQAMASAGLGVSLMHDMTIPHPRPADLAVRAVADAQRGSRWADMATLTSRRTPASEAFAGLLREAAGGYAAGAGREAGSASRIDR